MTARPKISLCMIVRDEEAMLGKCLEAVRGWVDEVCIVDTGSTDATITVAQHYGARVEEHPWTNSFAAARNLSLDMARGDWCLVLDADEVVRAEGLEELARIAADEGAEAAMVRFTHHVTSGERSGWLPRYFRNRPGHRYEGIVHEQVSAGLEASMREHGGSVRRSNIHVDHYGYSREVWSGRGKAERYLEMLEKAVADSPGDAYLAYKYADLLRAHPDRERMHAAFSVAARLVEEAGGESRPKRDFHTEVFALWAHELQRDGDIEWASDLVDRATRIGPATAHLHYVTAHIRQSQGQHQAAFDAFLACRKLHGTDQVAASSQAVTSWLSATGMVRALLDMDRVREAAERGVEEAQRYPERPELTLVVSEALARNKQHAEAVERCMASLRLTPAHVGLWMRVSDLLRACGMLDSADSAAERGERMARLAAQRVESARQADELLALPILGV